MSFETDTTSNILPTWFADKGVVFADSTRDLLAVKNWFPFLNKGFGCLPMILSLTAVYVMRCFQIQAVINFTT